MRQSLQDLFKYIERCFPKSYPEIMERELISENLFSPFTVELPQKTFDLAERFVEQVYRIKEMDEYHHKAKLPEDFNTWPINPSVLTCFDFHYSPEMGLKLIEVNTNASLYIPLALQANYKKSSEMPDQLEELFKSFKQSFNLQSGSQITIFDEKPENEGLYFEFLIFKEWFEQKGLKANIVSLDTFHDNAFDNIYNRYTDFYLAEQKSSSLYSDYISNKRKFSPNPREYALLADKKRLNPLRDMLEDTELKSIIPESKLFSEFEGPEDLWKNRKKYFLKPSQSFGSKGVFAGKSVSRKAFDNLYDPSYMAQEFCPAGRETFTYEEQGVEMKYDLRFFTYDGKIQHYGARLYQGQTTNMKTPLGGTAPIVLV